MSRPPLLCALLLAALLAGPSQGRVFENLGRGPFKPGGEHPGWMRAYAAEWTLNGADAAVEIWSASEPLPATLARMETEAGRQGAVAAFLSGETLAWGAIAGGGRIIRCWCTTSESGRQTVVFLFSQSDADFRRSVGAPPAAPLPDGIPSPPGARVLLTAANRDSGSTFAVFASPGSPQEARAFLAGSLAGAGWSPAPGAGAGTAGPLGLYLKGNALCGFAAKMSGHDGSCMVTVVHRRFPAGE